jgi:hypothetical protein
VIADAAGDLFGTTAVGTVFELVNNGGGSYTPTTLLNLNALIPQNQFTGQYTGLTADASGDLFGTTELGGDYGLGMVFELVNNGGGSYTPTTLLSFNTLNGEFPLAGLIADPAGDLFGTTSEGGAYADGTVFELVNNRNGSYTPTTVFSFSTPGGAPGLFVQFPDVAIADTAGDLFGTTALGGAYGYGTVFGLSGTGIIHVAGQISGEVSLAAAAEGTALPGTTTVATFTDTDASQAANAFTATIDWGDGTITTGTVTGADGSFAVTGGHTYADEGSNTVTATITRTANGTQITPSGTVVVGVAISASEGTSTGTTAVATLTDANPNATAADFTATINWGDSSTSTGTITGNGNGGFSVTGAHTYTDEGSYAVGVKITDDGGSTANASSAATVADAALSAIGVNVSATEGTSTGTATVTTFTLRLATSPPPSTGATVASRLEPSPPTATTALLSPACTPMQMKVATRSA